jgi:Fe-S oxidoreductase
MGGNTMRGLHQAAWWFHLVLVFGFIAWIPYSKLLHLFTSPANIYFQNLEPKGALPSLDMEQAETLGVSQMEQFTWKDLLDLDACTECGRCEVNCPATLTNKPLSPKALILDLRDYLHREGPVQIARKGNGVAMAQDTDATSPLVGPVIREETLWSCTTCRACMEQCPVMIEQVPKIVEMRRHLVMERAEFPDDLQGMVRSLEARGHPYPGATASRTDWLQGLELPQLAEQPDVEFEVLLWVGCAGALNERNQSVTRAVAQLLQRAGVRFAVLGREERCTGDPARRIGHEYLFTTLAQQNIATLARYNVRKILTACPHCFNTFKNEYPQLGGRYEVVHHSEFLNDLVASGRLTPTAGQFEHVTFHDPCYLGRYNDVYDAPRSVLDAIPGGKRSEPEWNRRNALCCGGGGGFAFMEETRGTRMNQNRTQQLLRTGAKTVAVGCPFCMIMVEDGVKTAAPDRAVEVLDIAEMLEHATQ